MEDVFQNAKWIAAQTDELPDGSWLLRREFSLRDAPVSARLRFCGLGIGVWTVNGGPVTDAVLAPFTAYDKTVLYDEAELAPLLHRGKNCVGVRLGNGFYNNSCDGWGFSGAVWRDVPKLLMRLTVRYADGAEEELVSDSRWRCAPGPAVYNQMREGERYDARLAQPGFDLPGFDDSRWTAAAVCRGAGGRLVRNPMEPERIVRTLEGRELPGGIWDFGENTSGWACIEAEGEPGQTVTLTYAERLSPDGGLDNAVINAFNRREGALRHQDVYVCRGGGVERYHPSFVYHGFRYVKAEGDARLLSIRAHVVHTDLAAAGSFACGNELVNRIHEACVRSTLTNYHSIPTDCPHREQNGWTADGWVSAGQALMNFDMEAAYLKWLGDFADMQRPDGQLPSVVPTPRAGYRSWGGPAWESAVILIPDELYRLTGSRTAIERHFPMMDRYLSFLSRMAEGDLLGYGLGDWCCPDRERMCSVRITDSAVYYADACAMARAARATGRDPEPYRALAERIRRAFRAAFLGTPALDCQTGLALALGLGLFEEAEKPDAARRLLALVRENGWHAGCGILGSRYLYGALSDAGYADEALRAILNPTAPSFAHWIQSGMTTLCEDWDMSTSLNHHMFSSVDLWFYETLAGIRFDRDSIHIEPAFPEEIGWVRASVRGVSVEWDDRTVTVTVPRESLVSLGGKRFAVGPGTHHFSRQGEKLHGNS